MTGHVGRSSLRRRGGRAADDDGPVPGPGQSEQSEHAGAADGRHAKEGRLAEDHMEIAGELEEQPGHDARPDGKIGGLSQSDAGLRDGALDEGHRADVAGGEAAGVQELQQQKRPDLGGEGHAGPTQHAARQAQADHAADAEALHEPVARHQQENLRADSHAPQEAYRHVVDAGVPPDEGAHAEKHRVAADAEAGGDQEQQERTRREEIPQANRCLIRRGGGTRSGVHRPMSSMTARPARTT